MRSGLGSVRSLGFQQIVQRRDVRLGAIVHEKAFQVFQRCGGGARLCGNACGCILQHLGGRRLLIGVRRGIRFLRRFGRSRSVGG